MITQAFMFEPEYTEEELEERSQGEEEVRHDTGLALSAELRRVGRRDWCTCLRCEMMLTDCESLCCLERPQVKSHLDVIKHGNSDEVTKCITQTERFQTLILDADVLQLLLIQIHNDLRKGPLPDPVPNR